MSDVTIPAELTLFLRRALTVVYAGAAENLGAAAADCATGPFGELPAPEQIVELVRRRATIADYERLFELVGDDLVTGAEIAVPDGGPDRRLLHDLIGEAIEDAEDAAHDADDPERVIAAGRLLERLLALRETLDDAPVAA